MERFWCCPYCGKQFRMTEQSTESSCHSCPATGIEHFCIEPPAGLMAPLEEIIVATITKPKDENGNP